MTVVVLFAVGTLLASAARGSFVLQDVGPWRGGKPDANITNRTIVVTPSTKFAMASRTSDGTSKFPGDYEQVSAQLTDLKDGAFVSVECQPIGDKCQALRLVVVRTDQPA